MDIKYPIVYAENELLFNNYGLAILQNAYDIVINEVLNNEFSLTFCVPFDSKLKPIIDNIYFVKCDNIVFVVNKLSYKKDLTGAVIVDFECEHIQFSVRNGYVNGVYYDGLSTYDIVNNLINTYMPTPNRFIASTLMTTTDIQSITFRNKNVLEALRDLSTKIGGELCFTSLPNNDGKFEIGILKPTYNSSYQYVGGGIGSFKLDIQIRDQKNVRALKREVDKTNLITRLNVFGEGGMTFEDIEVTIKADGVTPQVPSIVVPVGVYYFENTTPFNKEEGYFNFTNIRDKTELYWAGKAKWEELSNPRINYTIEIVDLRFLEQFKGFDTFQVGDVVTFVDNDFTDNQKVQLRVSGYKRYPQEPEKNSAVFSSVTNTIFYSFADFYKTKETIDITTNTNKEVKVASFEKVYIDSSEVVSDGVNPDYNGIYVINGYYNGTIFARNKEINKNALFLGENGRVVLYNEVGAGIEFEATDSQPSVRYSGSGITSPILTELNGLDSLFDVVITAPLLNGQTLKYDTATGKWINSF